MSNINSSGIELTTATLGRFDDLLTVTELAHILRVGRNKAYEVIRADIIPSIRIGRQIRISKQAVIDYLNAS